MESKVSPQQKANYILQQSRTNFRRAKGLRFIFRDPRPDSFRLFSFQKAAP
jgi:hypothetical protein